jgi:hypothetical protein
MVPRFGEPLCLQEIRVTMQSRDGWELNKHPDPQFANICADCPHCGREEWWVLFRDQAKAIVTCQTGNSMDHRNSYIIRYNVQEPQ